MNLLMYKSR